MPVSFGGRFRRISDGAFVTGSRGRCGPAGGGLAADTADGEKLWAGQIRQWDTVGTEVSVHPVGSLLGAKEGSSDVTRPCSRPRLGPTYQLRQVVDTLGTGGGFDHGDSDLG